MTIRRADVGDTAIVRALRLRAVHDAPDAFGSTYERELARTDEDWRRWFSPGVTFVFEDARVGRQPLIFEHPAAGHARLLVLLLRVVRADDPPRIRADVIACETQEAAAASRVPFTMRASI